MEPDDRIRKDLGVRAEWNGSQYVATSSVEHLHTIVGYGKTAEAARESLAWRIVATAKSHRQRVFDAIDGLVRELDSRGEANVEFSFRFLGDDGCEVTATDAQGKTKKTTVFRKRKKNGKPI